MRYVLFLFLTPQAVIQVATKPKRRTYNSSIFVTTPQAVIYVATDNYFFERPFMDLLQHRKQ